MRLRPILACIALLFVLPAPPGPVEAQSDAPQAALLGSALEAGLAIVLLPGRALLGLLVQQLIEGNMDSVQARSDLIVGGATEFSWLEFLATLLGAGILVPISEELYFRGLLHTWFWRKSNIVWLRVLASATIFGLAHADSIGVVFASAVIGVVNALAYERTRSLFIPIIVHITTNSIAVLLIYLLLALAALFPEIPL